MNLPSKPSSQREMLALDRADRQGVTRALERAYPVAKQLAEILELEMIEPWATVAKALRQDIGVALAERGRLP